MTEISSDLVIKRTDLAGSQIDSEMVFFNQNTGKYFATGPVGAEIWEYLTIPRTVSQICDHLLEKFEVDRTTCETQVQKFVGDLLNSGIVAAAL
ncbi:MAG: PqqD family protein [Henriciella sp.]|nr:PqqD family protein [Henriciella sp.]